MGKKKSIQLLILCLSVLSCDFTGYNSSTDKIIEVENLKDTVTHDDRNMEVKCLEDTVYHYGCSGIKDYFVLYGEDSLLMIPGFAIGNIYELNIESNKERYSSDQDFKSEFLYNPKNLSDILYWSYHIAKNKEIMHDYQHMTFDDFWGKYLYTEGNDTLTLINDTTLAYCLDKHDYISIFNYRDTGKTKVIKSEYQYEYSKLIEKQQGNRKNLGTVLK